VDEKKSKEETKKPVFDPSQIYPTVSEQLPTAQAERQMRNEQAKAIAGAELSAKGYNLEHAKPKSKAVDIVGGLIILSGALSILLNHKPISIAFNAIYVFVGLGIISRSAMARKIVVFASAIGLVGNILSLFATSLFLSGKASILPVLTILFSIAVQITVLSILTWHQAEKEFH
jgi:hypothetical protein